jgi:hypothetical protein
MVRIEDPQQIPSWAGHADDTLIAILVLQGIDVALRHGNDVTNVVVS